MVDLPLQSTHKSELSASMSPLQLGSVKSGQRELCYATAGQAIGARTEGLI